MSRKTIFQRKVKTRPITQEEKDWMAKNKDHLEKEIVKVNEIIEGLKIELDNVAKVRAYNILMAYEDMRGFYEKMKELSVEAVGGDSSDQLTKREYYDYLIKKTNYEIEKGIRIHFENTTEQLQSAIKEQEKVINTNNLVIKNINEILESGVVPKKKGGN